MSQDEFTKLFIYMERKFKSVNDRLEQMVTKSEFNRLVNTVDGIAKRLDDKDSEDAARDSRFERHMAWSRKVAIKTSIPLQD